MRFPSSTRHPGGNVPAMNDARGTGGQKNGRSSASRVYAKPLRSASDIRLFVLAMRPW